MPSSDDRGALQEQMTHHGIQIRSDGDSVTFDDPWANTITARQAD